jgi:tRNA pseudouridine32 synthase / 23S rRNA pseudouridine746 synthase
MVRPLASFSLSQRLFVQNTRLRANSVSCHSRLRSPPPVAFRSSSTVAMLRVVNNMPRSKKSAPHVALVWKVSRNTDQPLIEATLQETGNDEDDSGVQTTSSVSETESMLEGSDGTPSSVLLYESQLRKAQHAKKVGTMLSSNDLHVVHVDEYLVVVNKPPGVLTVPGINCNPSLLDLVYEQYGNGTGDPTSMIVHRLDMDTSGLVIFARTPDMTKKLHAQFRERKVTKEYECLVMGHLPLHEQGTTRNASLTIDLPLQRDHEHPPFMRVSTPQSEQAAIAAVQHLQKHGWKKLVRKRPKPSQTAVTVVEQGIRNGALPWTRLRLVPITGRTHQLRVHWYVCR